MEQEKQIPGEVSMNNDSRRKWHIGKEIPITLVITLVLQTAGIAWWAASISAQVVFLKDASASAQVTQTAIDLRQDNDSIRAENRIIVQLDKINTKLDALADKVRR
ncbi:MAG: hypothetical protein ACTS6J_02125 [Burkholderiales bacterium]